ncbi:ABC transporter ATP-binding protein [Clostridiaceae bacterium M8S5]|nr:ABC transporter ATP-binding protein [Clostridiaceae bacterium M8S5]
MIEVNNLSVQYNGKKVVKNVSFSINAGEIFGMIGANGAGKTTTIECIEGLRNKYDGQIRVLGIDPQKDRGKLHKVIGVQLQETSYQDKLKVKEICKLFSSFYKESEDIESLLKEFNLFEKSNSYVEKLSGGQRQKLSIVLALISKPKIVFLDELTTGLDPKSRKDMWQTILKLKDKGLTVYLTTHFMEEAEYLCDRVAIMKEGEIVALDTIDNLKSSNDISDTVSFIAVNGIEKDILMSFDCVKSVDEKDNKLSVKCDGDVFLKELNKYTSENDCMVTNIDVKKPSLEDIYFKYTGETIEDLEGKQ